MTYGVRGVVMGRAKPDYILEGTCLRSPRPLLAVCSESLGLGFRVSCLGLKVQESPLSSVVTDSQNFLKSLMCTVDFRELRTSQDCKCGAG